VAGVLALGAAIGIYETTKAGSSRGRTLDYWVAAVPTSWNITPNGRDAIMGKTILPSRSVIQPGGTVSISAPVTNTGTAPVSNLFVLLYFTDPSGNAFEGNYRAVGGQSFAPGQTRSYTFQWTAPSTAAPGAYAAHIGVFSSDWQTTYAWQTAPSMVTIGTGSAPTFAVGTTTVSPTSVAPGQSVTVTTHVTDTSAQSASSIIVECEVNNSADDANVTLQFVSGQAFSAGQTKSLAFVFQIPSNLPPGTYTIDVGVFSGDWAKLYTWGYRVATFSVQ